MNPNELLVCFAVKEEAKPFQRLLRQHQAAQQQSEVENGRPRLLITGIGRKNAEEALREAIGKSRPEQVISSGFAGALNPALEAGQVVFSTDEHLGLALPLIQAGALPVQFHCSDKIIVSAAEKAALRAETGAGAVEMESEVIQAICADLAIPCGTIRVISDAAGEDLPLDFNRLLDAGNRINYLALAGRLFRSPGKVPALLKFHNQTARAARNLAWVLFQVTRS